MPFASSPSSHREIQAHVPEAFWYISLLYRSPGPPPVQVEFKWDRHRLYDRETVAILHQLCLEAPAAVVASVQGSRKTRWAPNPLSTLEMQKRASQVRWEVPSSATQITVVD